MDQRRRSWKVYAGWASVFIVVSAPPLWLFYETLTHPKSIEMSGSVVWRKTGQPVATPRIIVTAWDWFLDPIADRSPHCFALVADAKGKFRLQREVDFRVSWIEVEAVAADGSYGHAEAEPRKDWLVAIQKNGAPKYDGFRYEEFRGAWVKPDRRNVIFIGPEW